MGETPQVSARFAALVRRHERAGMAANDDPRVDAQMDDEFMRPLLHEQLRECVSNFAQMASPAGTRIVSEQGLEPLLAFEVFSNIPVLREDLPEACDLVCDEYRAMAANPATELFGAELSLRPNSEVSVRPVLQMKVV